MCVFLLLFTVSDLLLILPHSSAKMYIKNNKKLRPFCIKMCENTLIMMINILLHKYIKNKFMNLLIFLDKKCTELNTFL